MLHHPQPTSTIRHYLKTLGEPALLTPAGRPVPFRTRKALGLLVYLAVEPRAHARDGLAELLWSRAAAGEARHSLANAISELRRRLGKASVETSNERVRLRTDLLHLDLARLLSGDVLGNEVDGPLDVDGFLEGFDLPDAVGFAHWKEAQRGGLVPPTRDALVKLIDRARRTGNFPELGRLGERLSRFDELSEDAVRARMESRAFAGDRLGALRLFEQWKMELASQMGAVPSELLEGMSMRLRRRGWERPGGIDIPAVRTDQWRDRPFVGRAAEYRELYEAWESTQRGEPKHRLLMGDSGVGKSTLVERITSVAALEGATVVRTQCHELEQELPYAAVSELILQLIDRQGASATPPEQLAELAQHIPAIHRRFPNLPEPLATQGEASRVRFSEATLALMQAVAEEHPCIVVVDDMHNCDDVSLAVLHYVLRHSGQHALQMLFLARPGETRRSQNARRLMEQGASVGIETMRILPLQDQDTSDLLDTLLADGHEALETLTRRALVSACGGVPLVLELLLREWRQSGGNSLVLQLDAITPSPNRIDAREPATDTYRLVLDRLFAGLEGDTKMVLYTAAILGRHLNEPGMYALADLTASQMMHGLGRLTELRILRDGGAGLEFANDLVRAHAYIAVPLSLRRLLHGRVADELIQRSQRGEADHGLDIAWHCMRSGRSEEAMEHLLDGANGAIARGATHEAEFRLASALDQFTGAKHTEAVLTLTHLIQEQGRWEESLSVLAKNEAAQSSLEGQVYRKTALIGANQMLPSEMVETISLMQEVMSHRPVNRRAALAAVELAPLMYGQSYDDSLLPSLISVVGLAEDLDWSSEEVATIHLAKLKLRFNAGMTRDERMQAKAELESVIARRNLREVPSRRSASLVSGVGILAGTMGDIEGSLGAIEEAMALSRRLDNTHQLAAAYANLALKHGWIGNYQRQRELAAKVLTPPIVGSASVYNTIASTYEYSLACVMLGDHAAARRALEEQRYRVPSTTSTSLQQTWMMLRADVLQLLGDESIATDLSAEALQLANGRVLARRTTAGAAARSALRILRNSNGDGNNGAKKLLLELFDERLRMDATEVAEILCAYLIAFPPLTPQEPALADLHDLLELLPSGAPRRLDSLGTPPPASCTKLD